MSLLSRIFYLFCFILSVFLAFPWATMADTYANELVVTVQNNNTVSYYNYPFIIPLNHTQLVSLGYITASGLDTNLSRTAVASLFPSSLSSANLTILVDQCLGNRANTYRYMLGYAPARVSFDIIVGTGGYFNVTDSASMEPGASDYYLDWKGYVDNSSLLALLFAKPGALRVEIRNPQVRVYENTTAVIISSISSGVHNLIVSKTGGRVYLTVDGVASGDAASGPIIDNANPWSCQSSAAPSVQWLDYRVGGATKCWFKPITIITSSTIPDLSGSGNHGYITWGSNPVGTSTYTAGVSATGTYAMGSDVLTYTDVPIFTPTTGLGSNVYENNTADVTGLPQYEIFAAAATSLGWTTQVLYAVMMFFTAVAMAAGAFIATGSLFGGAIMFVGTLAVASSTTVIPPWLAIVIGLALFFIIVLSRSL